MRLDEINDGLLLWGLPSRQGVAAIKKRVEATQGLYVLVPEMRPTLLGLEIAKTLKKKSIKHVYATDNMVGILFFKNKVKEILFFYKDYRDQHFSGICGSLYICLLARLHHVPIKTLQGEKTMHPAQRVPLLDEYMSFRYNDVLPAEDETVPEGIIQ